MTIKRKELNLKFKLQNDDYNPKETFIIEAEWDENDGDYRHVSEDYKKEDMTDDVIFGLVLLQNYHSLGVDFHDYEDDEFDRWFVEYVSNYYFTISNDWGEICHSPDFSIMYYGESGERYDVELPSLEEIFGLNEIFGDDLTGITTKKEIKNLVMVYGNQISRENGRL